MIFSDLEQLIERIGTRRRQLKIDAPVRCAWAIGQLPRDFFRSADSIDAHLYWFYQYVVFDIDMRQNGRPMERRQIIQSLRPTDFFDSVQRSYGNDCQVTRDILHNDVEGGRRKLFSNLLSLALRAGIRNIIENELGRLAVPRPDYIALVALADDYVRCYWSCASVQMQQRIRDAFILPARGPWLQDVLAAHFEYVDSLDNVVA